MHVTIFLCKKQRDKEDRETERERNILTEALIKVFYASLGTYLLKQQINICRSTSQDPQKTTKKCNQA